MPNKPRDYDEELRRVMDSTADSIPESPDEDSADKSGHDQGNDAEEVRKILLDGMKRIRRERLRSAEERYKRRLAEIGAKRIALPATREGRREMLRSALGRQRDLKNAVLTLQHRDFSTLTDSDVDSLLRQLFELGVLDESNDSDGDER